MIANHIHHALAQVQELQQRILEKQRFKGYSGRARAISGTAALVAACIMASSKFPKTSIAFFSGWTALLICALLFNFGAMLYWFLFDPATKRDVRRLRPAWDLLPPLMAGGILTLVFVQLNLHQLLYGTWMLLYGVANFAMRHALPRPIWMVGFYYIVAGAMLLLIVPVAFTNPWPMGIIFFLGEWGAGVVLHYDDAGRFSIWEFLRNRNKYEIEAN